MATATHSSTTKSKSRSAAAKKAAATRAKNAINLLKADHREVEKLFSQFTKASGEERKKQLSDKICMELKVHMQIEEEIFYPTSREFLDDDDIVNEAVVEHQAAKDLMEQIRGMDPADEMFDARMQVLQEQIEHHVEEEETEYFPKVQKTDMDLKAIGEQLMMRKKELMAQMKGDGMEMH
jgi:hemerythrin superfamily protein